MPQKKSNLTKRNIGSLRENHHQTSEPPRTAPPLFIHSNQWETANQNGNSVCSVCWFETFHLKIKVWKMSQIWEGKLRKHKLAKLESHILVSFYRGVIWSILTGNITNWHWQDRKALQLVIKAAQNITGTIYGPPVTSVKWDVCTRAQRY